MRLQTTRNDTINLITIQSSSLCHNNIPEELINLTNTFHPWDTKATCSILIITKVIQIPFHLQLPKLLIIFPNFTDTICYDDACHLKKFTQNLTRNQLTSTAKKMSQMVMVCDKFNSRTTRTCVQKNCSPYTYASLQVRFPLIQYHDYFNLLYRHDCFTGKYTTHLIHKTTSGTRVVYFA